MNMNLKRLIILIFVFSVIGIILTGCPTPIKPSTTLASTTTTTTIPQNEFGMHLSFLKSLEAKMSKVEGGKIKIGTKDKSFPDRYPEHEVSVDSFSLSRYEVTVAEYKMFIKAGGYSKRAAWSAEGWDWKEKNNITKPKYFGEKKYEGFLGDEQPITGISCFEAEAFAKACGMRLPTENEWEYAARGKEGNRYPWGNEWKTGYANVNSDVPVEVTKLEDGKSPFGMYNMCGNVHEWTSSIFKLYPGAKEEDFKGKEYLDNKHKVARGSSFLNKEDVDLTYRLPLRPKTRQFYLGFRLAK